MESIIGSYSKEWRRLKRLAACVGVRNRKFCN